MRCKIYYQKIVSPENMQMALTHRLVTYCICTVCGRELALKERAKLHVASPDKRKSWFIQYVSELLNSSPLT